MTHGKNLKFALVASTIAAPMLGAPAFAANQVEDIVVTAQKREERLQEVPIAITALGSAQLETRRISNAADLSALAPNLTTAGGSSGANDVTMAIRGLSVAEGAIMDHPACPIVWPQA